MIDDPVNAQDAGADWLRLLDPDPARASACYLDLHRQLRRFLEWDCRDADDAAQEVFVRGFRRIREGADTTEKGLRAFFFGIARNVIREGWKPKQRREQQLDPPVWDAQVSGGSEAARIEDRMEIEQYLRNLNQHDAALIVRYAVHGSDALVSELGVTAEALRVRVFRIRERLRAIRNRDGAPDSSTGHRKRRRRSRHGQTDTRSEEGKR